MLRFEIEVLLAGLPVVFRVEELDPWPDAEGYVRYAVYGNGRRSVVAVDKCYWQSPIILTDQDAWDYLEKMLYPALDRACGIDEVFDPGELEAIRRGIGEYLINQS